jgi:hypothetical protein
VPNAAATGYLLCPAFSWGSGGGGGSLLRETFAAEDRAPLRWPKRDCGLLAALRAGSPSFDASEVVSIARLGRGGKDGHALGLAGFTAFGLVLELFVVEKELFPGGKDKIGAAVDAGQYLVLKFH